LNEGATRLKRRRSVSLTTCLECTRSGGLGQTLGRGKRGRLISYVPPPQRNGDGAREN